MKTRILTEKEIIAKYGEACDVKNHTIIDLPFSMKIAWEKGVWIKRVACHKLIAENLKGALTDILKVYGEEEIEKLGINIFGGLYNCRKMRGGSKQSMHAWAIAIDLDPERNQLKESHKTARFARPEYEAMIDCFYNWGFIGLGREKDRDWMHFQINQ